MYYILLWNDIIMNSVSKLKNTNIHIMLYIILLLNNTLFNYEFTLYWTFICIFIFFHVINNINNYMDILYVFIAVTFITIMCHTKQLQFL